MKKSLLALLIFLSYQISYSQEAKYNVLGFVVGEAFAKTNLTDRHCVRIDDNSLVIIRSALNYNDTKYFEIFFDKKIYFVKNEEIRSFKSYEELMSYTKAEKDSLKINAESNSLKYYEIKKENFFKELNTTKSLGLTILHWSYYDESEHTDGTGIKIKIYNPTNKIIKYIWFSYIGYNPVGDKVMSLGSSIKTVKAVGPIDSMSAAEYQFDYLWFTDLVDTVKIYSIKVQYMDGTFKTISNPKLIILGKTSYNFLMSQIEL